MVVHPCRRHHLQKKEATCNELIERIRATEERTKNLKGDAMQTDDAPEEFKETPQGSDKGVTMTKSGPIDFQASKNMDYFSWFTNRIILSRKTTQELWWTRVSIMY